MPPNEDNYDSYTAYYWQEDRRITANYAIKLRNESGDPRIGDCFCHKKCRERGVASKRFPREVAHLGKTNHFWKGPGSNSSRDCEIRSRVRKLNEDSFRNNHYDNFLSDLIFHLSGSGDVLQLLEIGEAELDEYDILQTEVPRLRSSATPDIILKHGSRVQREETYVYVINTVRNRPCHDPPKRTELNTIVIRITDWSRDQIANFAEYGTRKFREEWNLLEARITKDIEEKEAILIQEVNDFRFRVRRLIEKGKLPDEIARWDSGENDQDMKDNFLRHLPQIEAAEEELRQEAARKAAERKAAEEEAAKREAAKREAARKAAEKKAAEEEAARKAAQKKAAEKMAAVEAKKKQIKLDHQDEITRRIRLLDENVRLAKDFRLLSGSVWHKGESFVTPISANGDLILFCVEFPKARRNLQNENLRQIVRNYFTPGFQISPDEFLSSVLETGIFSFSNESDFRSFEEINDFLTQEIQLAKETIKSRILNSLIEEYEELFGVETPQELIDQFNLTEYTVATREGSGRSLHQAYVYGDCDLEEIVVLKRMEARRKAIADKRAEEITRLYTDLQNNILASRKLKLSKIEDTLDAMASVCLFAQQLIDGRTNSSDGTGIEVLITNLLCNDSNFSDLTTSEWEVLGCDLPDVASIKIVDVSPYGNPITHRELAPAGLDSITKLEQVLRSCSSNLEEANKRLKHKRNRKTKSPRDRTKDQKSRDNNKSQKSRKKIRNLVRCPECKYTRKHNGKNPPDCGRCALNKRKIVRMEWAF